ncbi:MAG: hypothetical protein V3S97_06390 [Candidatus Bathyarchaeia archaeon]
MEIPHHKFGQTSIAKVRNSQELRQVLDEPWLESESIIIKPNWATVEQGYFADTETLRMLFEALDSKITITESHIFTRSQTYPVKGMNFNVGEKELSAESFLFGDGWRWLIKNPDWDWFKKGGYWEWMRKEEKDFLDNFGFTDLFKEFNVDYVNVTDEVWSGRIADPTKVKRAVESRFSPVRAEKIFNMVPKKLYELRGSTFISFASLLHHASFTLKNMFGMIPDPIRSWWHGPKSLRTASSILDINKVYHSLFNVYGICEALKNTAFHDPEGEYKSRFLSDVVYNVVKDLGIIVFGRNLASLDAILLRLTEGSIVVSDEVNRKPIKLALEEFGAIDEEVLKEAKMMVGDWLRQ